MKKSSYVINVGGTLLDLSVPKVMGIVNLTPDSFFKDSRISTLDAVLKSVASMLEAGADIIDLGAASSRPGASPVTIEEELKRLLPNVAAIKEHFPAAILSIDTYQSEVAKQALDLGAQIINDISAGSLDPQIMEVVASFNVPYIMMHMRDKPENMQENTDYDNMGLEIIQYLAEKCSLAKQKGIKEVIVDPGFGFSKNLEQNYSLLQNLGDFAILDVPILIGLSRKSMIYKLLNFNANEALNGTTALHMVSLMNGANILRVHDVKEAVETVTLFNKLYG